MLTIQLKYRTTNQDTINQYNYNYTGLFYKLYNNPELLSDNSFISSILTKFNLDKSIFESCKEDVVTKLKQTQADIDNKLNDIDRLTKELQNNTYETKREKRHKYKSIKKLALLKRNVHKGITFGSKKELRAITKLSQKKDKTNEDLIRLETLKREFKENRKLGFYLIGQANKKGNRKFDFDFNNNKVIFKPKKGVKVELDLTITKKYRKTLTDIQSLVDQSLIPLTIRLTDTHINIIYDDLLLNGYSFNDVLCKKEQKLALTKEESNEIYKKHKKNQEDRMLLGKIPNRYLAFDLNPENIGFCIVDKINDKGEFKVVHKEAIDLTRLNKRLGFSSDNKKTKKQNNKRKYEICNVWKYIFGLCKHYKVSHVSMEDLNFKSDLVNDKSKEFNRKTKNLWYRELTVRLITKYCNQMGLTLIEVNPCYSSFVGNMVYSDYDPIASSMEIARRGVVRYIKGSSIFPDIAGIRQEKLDYLLVENTVVLGGWKKVYSSLSLQRYRNPLILDGHIDSDLYSIKSKVKRYIPIK